MEEETIKEGVTETDETTETPTETIEGTSPLEAAKEINKKKEELLDREEKLQDRKEKLVAEEQVGGRAKMGQVQEKEKETPEELAERFDRGEVDILT